MTFTGGKCYIYKPWLQVLPRNPLLQLQTFGLLHLPWIQGLLHMAKYMNT